MALRNTADAVIMNAVGAAATGNTMFVDDFKNVIFSYATDGGGDANSTIKFQGSIQEDAPDFSAAQTVTNHWDYIEVVNLDTGAAIDGATGVARTGQDEYLLLEANVNGMRWVSATVTARSAGELTIKARAYYE
jgi:hypothetical protein